MYMSQKQYGSMGILQFKIPMKFLKIQLVTFFLMILIAIVFVSSFSIILYHFSPFDLHPILLVMFNLAFITLPCLGVANSRIIWVHENVLIFPKTHAIFYFKDLVSVEFSSIRTVLMNDERITFTVSPEDDDFSFHSKNLNAKYYEELKKIIVEKVSPYCEVTED
jgi:hypothetical protein